MLLINNNCLQLLLIIILYIIFIYYVIHVENMKMGFKPKIIGKNPKIYFLIIKTLIKIYTFTQ